MALVRILVDGYSLLHNWPELAEGAPRHSERARDELIQILTRLPRCDRRADHNFLTEPGLRLATPKNESSREVEILFSRAGTNGGRHD